MKTAIKEGSLMLKELAKNKKLVGLFVAIQVFVSSMLLVGAEPTPTPAPQLSIDFDVTAMFSWTQIIIGALMPVVYVVMGLGLGFLIINNLKHAFMGSMH